MIECERLPYKMKKAQRRFYDELRAEISAVKAAKAADSIEGDEENA